jgi:putative DNA primase/helicase
LHTGILRPARRTDLRTRRTAVAPSPPGTPHPAWTAFLDDATGGDLGLQEFLQRLVGYCLTGDGTEEILVFLYGEGGTGKRTFLGTIVASRLCRVRANRGFHGWDAT